MHQARGASIGFWPHRALRMRASLRCMFHFTNSSPDHSRKRCRPMRRRVDNHRRNQRESDEPSQSSLRFRGHAAGTARLGGMRKPDLGRAPPSSACSTSPPATWRSWVRPIERIAGRQGFAGCVRARFPHPKQGEPGILIAGHLDTVHPVGTLEKLQWRREGNKCFGPGIFDMKGGNYLALEAIRQLARAAFTTPLPITVLFTPRRGSRHALDPRHHRGGSRAQQIRAGAGAGPAEQRRRHRALRDRALQSRGRSASRAMPAPRSPRAAPRSARWRARSSPSTA